MRIAYNKNESIEVHYNVKDSDIEVVKVKVLTVPDKWIDVTKDYQDFDKEVSSIIINDLNTPDDDGGHGDQVL